MTDFKEIKRNLEKILGGKAESCSTTNQNIEAITSVWNLNISILLIKMKNGTLYYYATIGGKTPISWHNDVTGPETWIGENYGIEKTKDEMRSALHTTLDGVCHLGHFPRECLGEVLRAL